MSVIVYIIIHGSYWQITGSRFCSPQCLHLITEKYLGRDLFNSKLCKKKNCILSENLTLGTPLSLCELSYSVDAPTLFITLSSIGLFSILCTFFIGHLMVEKKLLVNMSTSFIYECPIVMRYLRLHMRFFFCCFFFFLNFKHPSNETDFYYL